MRFDVLMAVTVRIIIFRNMVLCSVVDRCHCFGGICCLYLRGWRLKIEASGFSVMLVSLHHMTLYHTLEDLHL